MNHSFYILDAARNPVPATPEQAEETLANPQKRRVAHSLVGPYKVSTVFLAVNHAFKEGPPVLFETMTFEGACWVDIEIPDGPETGKRYCTWAEAEAGHASIVAGLKAWLKAQGQSQPHG